MSDSEATRFINVVLSDEALSAELANLKDDPEMLLKEVRSRGFDVTANEVRDALMENLGQRISNDQLQEIVAAGMKGEVFLGLVIAGTVVSAAAAAF